MKWHAAIFLFVLIATILSGCSTAEQPPPPTLIHISESSSSRGTSEITHPITPECQPTPKFLESLAASLPFEPAVVTYQAYGSEKTLLVWFVSTSLTGTTDEEIQASAIQQAVQAAKDLMDTSECLLEFEDFQVTVVDSEYRQRFTGSIRTTDLPGLELDQTGGGTQTEQGGGRVSPNLNTLPAPGEDTCLWSEATLNLVEYFAASENYAVFYYVRDSGGNNVYAQWSVVDPQAALNIVDQVQEIADQITCLHPPATGISILLTLPDGQTLLTGYQPLNPGQDFDPGTFTFNFIDQP